ncbi:hypothetical protein [Gordonia westfalica]|uniref:Uncharacterized protein n=1 Tax=Gordonia westfalica TaxID=158898 RepID=A0A1H2DLE8_9ACTN|nr:hypothetical protein [Gordonia westfalica]SDT83709.1 hypothetical protein SAMN04488548_10129 [Gordonia westfalica]SDT83725.1 hypothetical protein SAMN04488548_10145 [Gordonia westfalica]SDT83945.1 hypothetical protein SAMN04488548_10535 [Gordonia westfalica]SDT83957.1 hypothetical protein SAMN04488548_10539 [Gordonia westfalica]SDT85272.1 hypothetical protein SAMN04488548_11823 [Gordonia westfalica]
MSAAEHRQIDGVDMWVQHLPDLHLFWAWVNGRTEFVTWPDADHPQAPVDRAGLVAERLFELVARAKAAA